VKLLKVLVVAVFPVAISAASCGGSPEESTGEFCSKLGTLADSFDGTIQAMDQLVEEQANDGYIMNDLSSLQALTDRTEERESLLRTLSRQMDGFQEILNEAMPPSYADLMIEYASLSSRSTRIDEIEAELQRKVRTDCELNYDLLSAYDPYYCLDCPWPANRETSTDDSEQDQGAEAVETASTLSATSTTVPPTTTLPATTTTSRPTTTQPAVTSPPTTLPPPYPVDICDFLYAPDNWETVKCRNERLNDLNIRVTAANARSVCQQVADSDATRAKCDELPV
jgi:hypothetical protein